MAKIVIEETGISKKYQKRLLEMIDDKLCTKRDFARLTGVSKDVIIRGTVYGIVPSLQSLIKIADALEVPLEYVLGETDDDCFFPAENPLTFQERLTALTEEYDVKFSKIAHSMPFPNSYFYDWLREGTLPSLGYLRALADYFGVSPDYLLGRTDDKK